MPIILVKGSQMVNAFIDHLSGKAKMHNEGSISFNTEYEKLLINGHFYALESGKSEDLAAFAHFFLTVTPYGQQKRDWQKDLGNAQTAKDESKVKQEPARDASKGKSPAKQDDDKKSVSGKTDKQSVGEKEGKTKK